MNVKFIGLVESVGEARQVTDNFRKRDVVVKEHGNPYENFLILQFINDMCDKCDGFGVGDKISVECNLQGKKWQPADGEERIFMNLNVTEALVTGKAASTPATIKAKDIDTSDAITPAEEEDDLPF